MYQFRFLSRVPKGCLFSTSLSMLDISYYLFLDISHDNRCEIISFWFWCTFPWLLAMLSHLYVFFGKYPFPLPTFNQIVYVWYWCIFLINFEYKPLSDISFANIFSHLVHNLFILLMKFNPITFKVIIARRVLLPLP